MDISRWTIEERMQLPDYCFGNRKLIGCWVQLAYGGGRTWTMSAIALPDPVCIWSFGCVVTVCDSRLHYIRMALGSVLPTSSAEMDALTPVFPYFGRLTVTPPYVYLLEDYSSGYHIEHRKGMVTGGLKFIVEGRTNVAGTFLDVGAYIVVSELPTNISGYLANQFLTKVR